MERTIQEIYLDALSGREEFLEELLMRLQPLIISSIRKYYNRKDEMDDLLQEGRLMILQSMEEYREDYSVPFLGYIKSRLKYLYLGKNRIRKELSLNVPVGEEGEEYIELLKDDFLTEEDYVKREEQSTVLNMVWNLPGRERQVVEGYYMENLSIGDIAKRNGITYRTVINTKRRALERIRREMEASDV
ncbi:sigma-70 family RNA polymerase sigma factor [Gudongella sp. DL1XJH-153]|uniref:sigma-70 family RNA polymerase sigma factor n=1 Tax=Gudongella sp. DL1XJH-153 TaxID=3409804 RepID=UPI003BB5C9A6